jgi:5-methylcytosine-specific restriction protein A
MVQDRESKMFKRSRNEFIVGLFLARCGDNANDKDVLLGFRKGGPPSVLKVHSWERAYELFWPALGEGRSIQVFVRSLKNVRDHYMELDRIAYLEKELPASAILHSPPAPLTKLGQSVLEQFESMDDEYLFNYVTPLLADEGGNFFWTPYRVIEKEHRWVDWSQSVGEDAWDGVSTGSALIRNEQLIPELIPTHRDNGQRWHQFALSFPAYEIFAPGDDIRDSNFDVDFSKIQEVFFDSGWLPDSLNILRGSLFFEQRSTHWQDRDFEFPWTAVLVEAIRLVVSGNPPTGRALTKLGLPVPGLATYSSVVCLACDAKIENTEWKHCPNCGGSVSSPRGYCWPDWADIQRTKE